MNRDNGHVVYRLKDDFPKLKTDSTKCQWLLASTAALVKDDALSSTVLVPYIESQFAAVLRLAFLQVEDQSELCVIALRFLAVVFTTTCRFERSQCHSVFCTAAADYIPVLLAVGKTNDPSLTPLLLIILSSLVCGPCSEGFSIQLAVHGGADVIRLVLKFLRSADSRTTAVDLLGGLMEVREGIRLCRQFSPSISEATMGTQLEHHWKLVRLL